MKWFTTRQAAEYLGLRPSSVVIYIHRGLLTAWRPQRDYLISEHEVERYQRDRRKPGRQRKERT